MRIVGNIYISKLPRGKTYLNTGGKLGILIFKWEENFNALNLQMTHTSNY